VPDHLNEVMMTLLQAMAEARPPDAPRAWLPITTEAAEGGVAIVVGTGDTRLPEDRIDLVRRRVVQMGGTLALAPAQLRIRLPQGQDAA
jgi:hypothetical protein